VTQDTNATQYELMKCFAKAHGGVSVVGDPDQSIYGWRSAEVENLNKMTRGGYFPSWILVILLIDRPHQTSQAWKPSTWRKITVPLVQSSRQPIQSSPKVSTFIKKP